MQELPNQLLIEIGFIASEFAVIDMEVRLDLIHLRASVTPDRKWDAVPWGFGKLLKAWRQERGATIDESLRSEWDDLNARIELRSKARNLALHGVWTASSRDDYLATILRDTTDNLHTDRLPTTYAALREQSELIRALRSDLVLFLRRIHGTP